jgi:hypothetical protein
VLATSLFLDPVGRVGVARGVGGDLDLKACCITGSVERAVDGAWAESGLRVFGSAEATAVAVPQDRPVWSWVVDIAALLDQW